MVMGVRFNVHANTNGCMVLDYGSQKDPLIPDDNGIYDDEKHAEQIIIKNISRVEAERVSTFLNNLHNKYVDMVVENHHLNYYIDMLTGRDRTDYLVYLITKHYNNSENDEVKMVLDKILEDLKK